MTLKKKTIKPVVPSLQGATVEILNRVADWMESNGTESANRVVYGPPLKLTKLEVAVLEEARKLAINYVRLGAKQ